MPVPSFVKSLVPPTPLSKRLATQSILFAVGEGTFTTGSAVFFLVVVGLTPTQVGLGLTIAGIVDFVSAYPMGRLADRFGPKRMWAVGSFLSAVAFLAWPFMEGFTAALSLVLVLQVMENLGGSGRNAYVIDVMPAQERVRTQAYMYSSLNLGFTIGAGLGGIALVFDSDTVIRWVPLFTSALMFANAFWITRLPDAPHDLKVATRVKGAPREVLPGKGPLRNVGWMALSLCVGTLWTNQVLLHTVIPLWLIAETDAPRVLLAWLFATNTILCIFLPPYTSRGVRDVSSALRAIRISTGFFVVSCAITAVTHSTVGFVTVLLVWLGHMTVTGAELYLSAGSWAFQSELMDPARRGEYQGVQEVFGALGSRWAPALFTFLAISWGDLGWAIIAGIIVAAGLGVHPAARRARRFLDEGQHREPATVASR